MTMILIKQELKKIYSSPITIAALVFAIVFTTALMLFGETDYYTGNLPPLSRDGSESILRQKRDMPYFKGEINDAWIQKYTAEEEAIASDLIKDPDNMIPEEEQNRINSERKAAGGEELEKKVFLKDEVRLQYLEKYEDFFFRSRFHEFAEAARATILADARLSYDGKKRNAIEDKINSMFDEVSENRIYYNYNIGYHRFRNVHSFYLYTLVIVLLGGLAPMFASESMYRTDSIIFADKYGRTKDVAAKIIAGFIFAISSWILLEFINFTLTYFIYGFEGGESVWTDWIIFASPFTFNNFEFTAVTLLTSLAGVIYTSAFIMLVSAMCSNHFYSLGISAVVLYIVHVLFRNLILGFDPLFLLIGQDIWTGIRFNVLFDQAIPFQFTTFAVVLFICAVFVTMIYFIQKNKEITSH